MNVPAALEAWVAYRLINTHVRASRAMALGLLLNLIVIILAVGSSIALPVLAYFVIASLIGISHRLWLANGIARDKRRRHAERLQYFFTLNSIWQGAHMGALVAIALPQVSSIAQIIMVLSIATQFGALAYTSRTLPVAALWHISALGLGLSVGLAQLLTPLAWLTFPFDKVKIDRSFVNDLESKAEARSIVGAVIRLANELGICTLAEGVEHEDQLQHLRQQGCDMVQGWLFGKAMPADHYFQTQRVLQKTAA